MPSRSRRFVPAFLLAAAAVLAPWGVLRAQDAKAIGDKLSALREAAADRDLDQTERLFAEFESLAPGDDTRDEARLLLGKTRMIAGRLPEAAAAVQAIVNREASPWHVKALYLTAESSARRREWNAAAEIYAKRVEWAMSDLHAAEIAALYREIADGAFDGDIVRDDFGREKKVPDWPTARRFYERARAAFPGAKDAALLSYRIGKAALESGDPAAARAEWIALREKGAGEWADDALFGIGLAELRLGRMAEARAAFQKVLEEGADGPFAPLARIELGRTWNPAQTRSDEELARVLATWREFLRLHPAHEKAPDVAWMIAEMLGATGKLHEAADAYRDYVKTYPTRAEAPVAQDRAAQAHFALGEFDRAIAEWRVLLATWPNHELWPKAQANVILAAFRKGEVAFEEKRDEDARAALEAFLAQYPADASAPNAQRLLADILARAGKHAEAVEAYRLVATKFPQSPWAAPCVFQIATLYEGPLADLEKALAAYEEVVAKWPASDAAGKARGILVQMKGKSLQFTLERTFRTDEEPSAKVSLRNVSKVRMKAYKVRLDEYVRRKGGLAGVEQVEVDVVKPDQEWDWTPADFAKYRLLERTCPLPLPKPGAYVVTAAEEELTATFLVVVSDLTVIGKSAVNQGLVFVYDERTGEPVAGAKVSLLGGGEGVTGADGVWRKDDLGHSQVRAMVSGQGAHAGHFAFATGEGGTTSAFGYSTKVFLQTDRPVYRPGQTVTLRGILRRVADGRYITEKGWPVVLRVMDPRGAMLLDTSAETDEFGVFERTLDLAPEPSLGTYSLQADADGRTFTQNFDVLAYRKPDVLAELTPEKRAYQTGDTVKATLSLRYTVGGVVAGAPVTWTVSRGPFVFDASVHEAFAWFFKDAKREAELAARRAEGSELFTRGEGTTDADGKLAISFTSEALDVDRTYVIAIEAQDPNRRWISTSSSVPVTTRGIHVICRTEKKVVQPGQAIQLEVTTVDPLHIPLAVEGRAVLVRRRLVDQHFVDDEVMTVPAKTGDDGRAVVQLKAAKAGEHVLRFVAKDARGNDVTGETPVTVSGDAEDLAKQARLVADREFYREGDVAKVFVNVPVAPVPVLFTYEGERVLEYRIVRATERASTIDVPLRAEHAPNVFLRMAVAKGGKLYEDGDEVAVFQYLDVKVTADPSEMKPGGKVTIRVVTTDQSGKPVKAEVGVDVVDSAIYQIAPDGTPQVKPFFYDQRRTHGVRTCASVGALPAVTKPTNKDLLFEQMRRLGKAQFEAMQEYVRLGKKLLEQGDQLKGVEELRKALEIAPGNYEVRALLDAVEDSKRIVQDRAKSKSGMSPPAASAPAPRPQKPGQAGDARMDAPAEKEAMEGAFEGPGTNGTIGIGGGAGGAFGGRKGGARRLRAQGGGAEDKLSKDAKKLNDAEEDDHNETADIALLDAEDAQSGGLAQEFATITAYRRSLGDMAGALAASMPVVPAELRQTFADTAHAKLVRTGDDGTAVVEVELPDNLTEWNVNARGATTGPLVGEGATRFRTAKRLLVRPDAPRFLVQGDWTTATGTLHSSLDAEAEVTLRFTAEGMTVGGEAERKVTLRPGEVRPFDGRLDTSAHGLAKLRIDALTSVESDAAQLGLPVLPFGLRRIDGASGTLTEEAYAELDLPAGVVPGTAGLSVTLSPSIDVALFESLAYVGTYPWGCVEQTVNRFLPALAVRSALGNVGSTNEKLKRVLDATVDRSLAALYAMQNDDGSFGWFGARSVNAASAGGGSPEMTAYALLGMIRAQHATYRVSQPNLARAIAAAQLLLRGASPEDRAFLLHALAVAQSADIETLNTLFRERTTLRPRGVALLALAMQRSGRPSNAVDLVRVLETQVIRDTETGLAHWAGNDTLAKDARIVRPVADAEPTAYALLAMLDADPKNPLCDEAAAWLLRNRRGAAWRSTRDTGAAISALALHASLRGVQGAQGDVSVFVNDGAEPVAKVALAESGRPVDAPRTAVIPADLLRVGKNKVVLRRTGTGRVHWSATLASVEAPKDGKKIEAGGVLVKLDRDYTEWHRPRLPGEPVEERIVPGWSVVVPKKRPDWNGRPLRMAGTSDKVRVTLTLSTPEAVTNVMVEDWLPAGFEVVTASAEGPFDREERRDDRQVFFLSRVAGKTTLSYVLQAVHPGEYRTLPALARLMYEPEIHAWTSEERMTVTREPGAARRGPSPEEVTPDEVWALALRAFVRKDWASARSGLDELRTRWELTPEVLEELWARMLVIGVESKDAKLLVEAAEQLNDRNPRRAPQDLVTRRALADAYRNLGEHERAMALYRDLVRDAFATDMAAAQGHAEIGNPWRARDLLLAALRRMPDTGWTEEGEFNLARATLAMRAPIPAAAGRRIPITTDKQPLLLDEGVRMLRRFQAFHASSVLAHEAGFLAVQTLLKMDLGADAVTEGTRFLTRHPKSRYLDDVTLLVAQGHFQAGAYDQALAAANALQTNKFPDDGNPDVLVESPFRTQAIHLAAKVAHLRGDLARAVDLYRQVSGLYPDAADALRFLTETGLQLREVETSAVGAKAILHVRRKNAPEVTLEVYAVDFMILYALRRDLSQVNKIDLSGIEPVKRWSVAKKGAEDFRWGDEEIELPAKEKGVYLVTARAGGASGAGGSGSGSAGDLFASSVVIVSDLQVDVQESGGRLRVYTSNRVTGAPWGEVYVKVGDGSRIQAQGFTDARGVLDVPSTGGGFSVVAEKEGHVALWRR